MGEPGEMGKMDDPEPGLGTYGFKKILLALQKSPCFSNATPVPPAGQNVLNS